MGFLMSLLKQAKTLSKRQITLTTALLQQTRYPTRNLAIFLLSVKAGLRAKEIASLTWDMVTDAEGNLGPALHLRDEASKGSSGRVIPLNKELRSALQKLHDEREAHLTSSPQNELIAHQPLQSSTSSLNGTARRVSKAAPVTQDVARSSPTQRVQSRLSEGHSEMFKCSLDIERSPPPSATSKRMWKHRNGLLTSYSSR